MTNYFLYQVEDFARDESFRAWVLEPDPENRALWKGILEVNPHQHETISQARVLVITVHERFKENISEDTIGTEIDKLAGKTGSVPISKSEPLLNLWNRHWWKVAAVLVAVSGLGWWLTANVPDQTDKVLKLSEKKETLFPPLRQITRTNATAAEQTIILNDSSVVTLLPGSSLTFPSHFPNSTREVTLKGDAFFEVATNKAQPFLVYAGETITRVLGTSFRITAFDQDDLIKISVRSGKVSVFRSHELDLQKENSGNQTPGGIVLAKNEQAVFNKSRALLEKIGMLKNDIVPKTVVAHEFIFDDTPVTAVFGQLEKIYGMEIEFDEKLFSTCPITTSFNEETLIERINTICQAIGATYKPENGKIVVSGKGCSGP